MHVTEERSNGGAKAPKRRGALPRGVRELAWPSLAVAAVCGVLLWLTARATSVGGVSALSARPKLVSVLGAHAAVWRGTREYVGAVEPWVEAKIGPQFMSAYLSTVLVRPGAAVKKGEVLATLDCRSATASGQAVEMQAQAIQARQRATASEAARLAQMLDGGFASENEVEQKLAQNQEQEAQVLATLANVEVRSLESADCVLKAPFDGDVDQRFLDPGAFARPGVPVLRLVDRSTLRLVADVPETDYGLVAPGTPVRVTLLATGQSLEATVTRRSPMAEPATRTIRVEMDVPDQERRLPVGTTARMSIDIGLPRDAVELPLSAATVHGHEATLFVVEGVTAHRREATVLGERGGNLYLGGLAPGERVVTQGRTTLLDGDRVAATLDGFADRQHPLKAGGLP